MRQVIVWIKVINAKYLNKETFLNKKKQITHLPFEYKFWIMCTSSSEDMLAFR